MVERLEERVTRFVDEHPGLTIEQIARGVVARTAAVRDVLASDAFSVSLRAAHPSDRAQVYRLARKPQDEPGQAANVRGALVAVSGRAEPTQEDQILTLLADGALWSSHELYRRVFCVLHSRIAALRKKLRPHGFDIEHTGGGSGTDVHWYRIVAVATSEEADSTGDSPSLAAPPPPGIGSASSDASAHDEHDLLGGIPTTVADGEAGASEQLQLGVAA